MTLELKTTNTPMKIILGIQEIITCYVKLLKEIMHKLKRVHPNDVIGTQ